MNTILVTGPSNFLGYHVIKLLNQRGIKPRVLFRSSNGEVTNAVKELKKLDIDEVQGGVEDLPSLQAACKGVDTVFHMNFVLKLGGGEEVEKALHEGNVVGTRNVLDTATQAGVARVVVSSSVLTVGLNREPKPLDETADWGTCRFDLPYALSRRQAEQEALARPNGAGLPTIVAVNPSFTMGPDDFVGAPLNGLVKRMTKSSFRITAPIGFSVLDVRDFAEGVLRAAQNGHHGRRYILSGENLTSDTLLKEVAAVRGIRPPHFLFPLKRWMLYPLVTAYEMVSRQRRKTPKVTRSILQLWGRHAWYDTTLARKELGWEPRPLPDTLRDTLNWLLPDNRK
jgi:dihydroflavonol-4-reductase